MTLKTSAENEEKRVKVELFKVGIEVIKGYLLSLEVELLHIFHFHAFYVRALIISYAVHKTMT